MNENITKKALDIKNAKPKVVLFEKIEFKYVEDIPDLAESTYAELSKKNIYRVGIFKIADRLISKELEKVVTDCYLVESEKLKQFFGLDAPAMHIDEIRIAQILKQTDKYNQDGKVIKFETDLDGRIQNGIMCLKEKNLSEMRFILIHELAHSFIDEKKKLSAVYSKMADLFGLDEGVASLIGNALVKVDRFEDILSMESKTGLELALSLIGEYRNLFQSTEEHIKFCKDLNAYAKEYDLMHFWGFLSTNMNDLVKAGINPGRLKHTIGTNLMGLALASKAYDGESSLKLDNFTNNIFKDADKEIYDLIAQLDFDKFEPYLATYLIKTKKQNHSEA